MSRVLRLATVLLACVSVASACTLDSGPYPDQTGGGGLAGGGAAGAGGTSSGGTGSGGILPTCGNGKVDPGEDCDLGAMNNDTGACTNDCKLPKCGDGILQASNNEECDLGDKNADSGACTSGCKNAKCGDGLLQASNNEECDLGDKNADSGACTSGCKNAKCGDGLVEDGKEACDDHNTTGGDGCDKACALEPGWSCSGVPTKCTPICGDSLVVGSEVCDDGNTASGDGCSKDCALEGMCGNMRVDPGEVCDGGPDCKMSCTQIAADKTCGKAIVIQPGAPDDKGVMSKEITGDTTDMPPNAGDLLFPPSCDKNAFQPKLYVYTTGKRGSIVTAETKDAGDQNFTDTVVWIYRDCLGKGDEEVCDDDSGAGNFSKARTGYLPPRTTIYIAVSGAATMVKGQFKLVVTEQPVTLLLGLTFDTAIDPLTSDAGMGDMNAKWKWWDGAKAPANTTGSWSGKGYALANDNPNINWKGATLRSASLPFKNLTKMFIQYDIDFMVGGGSRFSVDEKVGAADWTEVSFQDTNFSKPRRTEDISSDIAGASSVAVGFKYDDQGQHGNYAKVDDLWVYGY
jgi:cysteine-rich repeat protein